MSTALESSVMDALEGGPSFRFAERPDPSLPSGPAIYTAWKAAEFLTWALLADPHRHGIGRQCKASKAGWPAMPRVVAQAIGSASTSATG
jgi:hypothetical protein